MDVWTRRFPETVLLSQGLMQPGDRATCDFGHYLRRITFVSSRENPPRDAANRGVSYVASGANNDVFNVKYLDTEFVLKVGYYDWITIRDFKALLPDDDAGRLRVMRKDPLNTSWEFARRTNQLVTANYTPHFAYVYWRTGSCFNVLKHIRRYVNLAPLPAGNAANPEGRQRLRADRESRSRLNDLTIMERFDYDLTSAIKMGQITTIQEHEECLFQVLFSIMVLQAQYPGAQHNDLHPGNVFLKRIPDVLRTEDLNGVPTQSSSRYQWNTSIWNRPACKHFCAIADFDFADLGVTSPRNVKVSSNIYRNFGIQERQDLTRDFNKFASHFILLVNESLAKHYRAVGGDLNIPAPTFGEWSPDLYNRIQGALAEPDAYSALHRLFPPNGERAPALYVYQFGYPQPPFTKPPMPRDPDMLTRLDTLSTPVLREVLQRITPGLLTTERTAIIRQLQVTWPLIQQGKRVVPVPLQLCSRSPRVMVEKWSGRKLRRPYDIKIRTRAELCHNIAEGEPGPPPDSPRLGEPGPNAGNFDALSLGNALNWKYRLSPRPSSALSSSGRNSVNRVVRSYNVNEPTSQARTRADNGVHTVDMSAASVHANYSRNRRHRNAVSDAGLQANSSNTSQPRVMSMSSVVSETGSEMFRRMANVVSNTNQRPRDRVVVESRAPSNMLGLPSNTQSMSGENMLRHNAQSSLRLADVEAALNGNLNRRSGSYNAPARIINSRPVNGF